MSCDEYRSSDGYCVTFHKHDAGYCLYIEEPTGHTSVVMITDTKAIVDTGDGAVIATRLRKGGLHDNATQTPLPW